MRPDREQPTCFSGGGHMKNFEQTTDRSFDHNEFQAAQEFCAQAGQSMVVQVLAPNAPDTQAMVLSAFDTFGAPGFSFDREGTFAQFLNKFDFDAPAVG